MATAVQQNAVSNIAINLSTTAGSIAQGLRSVNCPYGNGLSYGYYEAYNDTATNMFSGSPPKAWIETSVQLTNPGMLWNVIGAQPLIVTGSFQLDLRNLDSGYSPITSLLGSNAYRAVFTWRPGLTTGPIYWAKSVPFDIVTNCTPVSNPTGYRISSTVVYIEWEPGASKVLIERSTDGVNWTTVVTNYVGLDYTDNVIPGVEYIYRMYAICQNNGNDYTSVNVTVEFPSTIPSGFMARHARLRR